tara:strand:- start:311 stop:1258 length:948 start_codon:yes stop_codon:yes gene_type:complete
MKILIELPTWLGDAVMVTPAIENLSHHYKDLQITLLGTSAATEVFKNHPKVIKIYILDRKFSNLFKTIKDLSEFDEFFSFRSSLRSKFVKYCISSKKKHQFDKSKFKKEHQVEKYNNFINNSIASNRLASKLILHSNIKSNSNSNINSNSNSKLLGINPGASYGSAKRWYPERFADVAYELSHQYDIIIFGGPGEKEITSDIEKYLLTKGVSNYENLSGKTSITELINKISKLDLFITSDSGPMHLAAALQVPTVAIFGPTKDSETSQWMNEKSTIIKMNLDCQPCMKRICPLQHHNCMKQIQASDVLGAAKVLN